MSANSNRKPLHSNKFVYITDMEGLYSSLLPQSISFTLCLYLLIRFYAILILNWQFVLNEGVDKDMNKDVNGNINRDIDRNIDRDINRYVNRYVNRYMDRYIGR